MEKKTCRRSSSYPVVISSRYREYHHVKSYQPLILCLCVKAEEHVVGGYKAVNVMLHGGGGELDGPVIDCLKWNCGRSSSVVGKNNRMWKISFLWSREMQHSLQSWQQWKYLSLFTVADIIFGLMLLKMFQDKCTDKTDYRKVFFIWKSQKELIAKTRDFKSNTQKSVWRHIHLFLKYLFQCVAVGGDQRPITCYSMWDKLIWGMPGLH